MINNFFWMGVMGGLLAGAGATRLIIPHPAPCAQAYDQANHLKNVDQQIFDTQRRVIAELNESNVKLEKELRETRGPLLAAAPRKQSPAEIADSGPVLTGSLLDPSCRRFCGGSPIPPEFLISTVITDARGAVRWVLPGKLRAVGYDGDYPGGYFFHFDNGFWTGPYQFRSIPH